jgi:hypothetical protein
MYRNLIAIVIGLFLPVFVWAIIPATPHQFYGTVSFDSGSASDGLLIEVKIDNIVVGNTITSEGKYGYDSIFYVTDDGSRSGKTIEFYVSGINSGETFSFSNGASTNLNLTVPGTIGVIEETNEGTVIENETMAVAPLQSANIKLGDNLSVTVSSNTSTNAVINEVRKLNNAVFIGSMAVIAGNNLLNAYEIDITGDNLEISVTINYNDTDIDETTIRPYRFNGTSWVTIESFTIDKSANTVTFKVSSAQTPYAVFGEEEEDTGGSTEGSTTGTTGGTTGGYVPSATYTTGDIDKDGAVGVFDFNLLMVSWGNNPANSATDLDNNGKVDIFDFNLLMVNWG